MLNEIDKQILKTGVGSDGTCIACQRQGNTCCALSVLRKYTLYHIRELVDQTRAFYRGEVEGYETDPQDLLETLMEDIENMTDPVPEGWKGKSD